MPKTVLIVEEHFEMLALLCTIVRNYDYCVVAAMKGQEAFEKAKLQTPDLLLIDISIEPIEALSAVRKIKNLDNQKDLPVIALTRYNSTCFHRAIQAGCNELLEKPIDFRVLKFLLKQYLR